MGVGAGGEDWELNELTASSPKLVAPIKTAIMALARTGAQADTGHEGLQGVSDE